MKIIQYFLLLLLLCFCSFKKQEVIILKELNQFDTFQENEQLGINLATYLFATIIPQKYPEFTKNDFKDIKWSYFVTKKDKKISFRLTLQNDALKKKSKLVEIFTEILEEQIQKLISDKLIFEKAEKLTFICLNHLDNDDKQFIWDLTSNDLKKQVKIEQFFNSSSKRSEINKIGGNRTLLSKHYYSILNNSKSEGLYEINITYEKDKNMLEQFLFENINDSLKIIGYTALLP